MTMRRTRQDDGISAGRQTGLRWAAVAAATLIGGCAAQPPASTPAKPAVATARPASPAGDLDTLPPTAPSPTAPVVNVFGELNGVGTGAARPIGDEGFQQHTFADEGYDADVVIDPAGKQLCFASTRHGERSALYLQRTDGSAVTRLTSDDSDNAFPTFSPDGKTIAFCSTRTGVWAVYTMDTDGRTVVTVGTPPGECVHPSFSPDGGRLVYSCMGARSRQWELWVTTLATGERQQIGYGLFPAWAPTPAGGSGHDVDRIAFQRARQRGGRWFSLWTLELANGEAHKVTEVAVSSNAAIVSPTWSPDGRRLAFATVLDPAKQPAVGAKPSQRHGEQDVWTVAADGTDRRRLTDGNGVNLSPCWSADGRVYFISNRGGTENVWSVRPDAGQTFTAANTAKTVSPIRTGPTPPLPDAIGATDDR